MKKPFKMNIDKYIKNNDIDKFEEYLLNQLFTVDDLSNMLKYIEDNYKNNDSTVSFVEFIKDTKDTMVEENVEYDSSNVNLDSISLHMQDIREHDLLNADEEVEYATQYQKYNKILNHINECKEAKKDILLYLNSCVKENIKIPILYEGNLSSDNPMLLDIKEIKKDLKVKTNNDWYYYDSDWVEIDMPDFMVIEAVNKYKEEKGNIPFFKNTNEVNFKKIVSDGYLEKPPLYIYILNDFNEIQKLEYDDLEELVSHYKDKIVNSNLRLVISIAKRMSGQGMPLEDLIQEGSLGLMKAAYKYNPKLGFRFSTYATWWIRQSIRRGIADQGRTIRLPVHRHEQISKINKISTRLSEELSREPTLDELSKVVDRDLGIPRHKLVNLLNNIHRTSSIDQKVSDENDNLIKDYIQDDTNKTPELTLLNDDLKRKLLKLFDIILDEREKTILILRYGIHSNDEGEEKEYTLQDIGTVLNLTRERIRQIEIKALKKLRHPVCQKYLIGYKIHKKD